MAYTGTLGQAGALAGAGTGGLLGRIGGILDTPRRAVWSALGLPETGAEFWEQRGVENPLLRGILGFATEAVADPINILLGGLGGLAAGRKFGSALDQVNAYRTGLAPLAQDVARKEQLARQLVQEAGLAAEARAIPRGTGPVSASLEGLDAARLPAGSVAEPLASDAISALRIGSRQQPAAEALLEGFGVGGRTPEGMLQVIGPPTPYAVPGLRPGGGGWTQVDPGVQKAMVPVSRLPAYVDEELPTLLDVMRQRFGGTPYAEFDALRRLAPEVTAGGLHATELPLNVGRDLAQEAARQARAAMAQEMGTRRPKMSSLAQWLADRGYGGGF